MPKRLVQGGVQIQVTAPGAGLVLAAGRSAEDFVAAAVGDAAELLDADVEQFAGSGAFVAADGFCGGPVLRGQGRQVVPLEDAVGRGGGDPGSGSKPQRSDAMLVPHAHHNRTTRRPVFSDQVAESWP